MSAKQKAKHEADALLKAEQPKAVDTEVSAQDAAKFFVGPDTQWIFRKQRATCFGDAKGYPAGLDKYKKEDVANVEPTVVPSEDVSVLG